MEVCAAIVSRMDQAIGRIVTELEQPEQLDNTLVLFLQDNRGCAETLGRRVRKGRVSIKPSEPTAPMSPSKLQLDMIPTKIRDGWPVRMGHEAMPGPVDTYVAYGRGWANVSNTPFREYKHWVHGGGISTPLIAHWPSRITRKGELEHQPGHLIDLMATCVDVAVADYPVKIDGIPIHPLEVLSLMQAFQGRLMNRDALYWEHESNRAIRHGPWKLVARGLKGPWELYRIDDDRSELHDLADQQPEVVAQRSREWSE